jgi:2-(1,2-epoxy-1,2-dihydrophenyl)acetyl-CoA isomerase
LRLKSALLKMHKGTSVPVKFHLEDRIAVVTLARPENLNAISSNLLDAFGRCLDQADASVADIILLEAQGRSFCAGDDLVELAASEPTADYVHYFVKRLQDISRKLMFGSKPVICAAQGYIVGGGAAWPLNADFSILADDAVMFCPEARWGMFPSGGVTALLPECCGPVRASEIIWRGVRVGAAELVEDGIAGQCVPAADLREKARALALEIADLPAASRRRMKILRAHQWQDRIEAAMAIESQFCIESALDPEMRAKVKEGQK